MKRMCSKKQNGVSLITVVITVVVVIILTTIAMATSSELPDEANFAKYIQEVKNIQTGIESVKIKNSRKGTTVEKLTEGFKRVELEEAPSDFLTFDEDGIFTYGYLINLETIGYVEAEYGQAYNKYETLERPLKFGDKDCDVFVFDANWNVYYVKGIEYDGKTERYYVNVEEANPVLYGDVNEDGGVDTLDRMILARYLAGWEGYTVHTKNSDVNKDGKVDDKDLTIMKKYLSVPGSIVLPHDKCTFKNGVCSKCGIEE